LVDLKKSSLKPLDQMNRNLVGKMIPIKFWFIWSSDFREDLFKSANQKQELPVVAMFVNGSRRNEHYL
jgi:hypothetical protein